MTGRRLLIALIAAALYAGVLAASASADQHRARVTLVTGQVLVVTVNVPPAARRSGPERGRPGPGGHAHAAAGPAGPDSDGPAGPGRDTAFAQRRRRRVERWRRRVER